MKKSSRVLEETVTMMKSALLFSLRFIHFYLFTDDEDSLVEQTVSDFTLFHAFEN